MTRTHAADVCRPAVGTSELLMCSVLAACNPRFIYFFGQPDRRQIPEDVFFFDRRSENKYTRGVFLSRSLSFHRRFVFRV